MPQTFNIFEMMLHASFMVQFVLLSLIFFSITSWAIIFIKYRYLKKALNESLLFTDFFWKKRDFSEAYAQSKKLRISPVAKVFRAGYIEFKRLEPQSHANRDPKTPIPSFEFPALTSVERALQRGISSESSKMNQLVPFLATTGNTTPFIGLFGTVWGIMNSFHGIGQTGAASLAVVAPGISEALVATAVGLGAAIPAVIAFNYFTQKIRTIESEMSNFSVDFINIVERQLRQKSV